MHQQIMFMNGNGTVDVPSVSVTGETVIAISSLMRKHEVKISFLPGPDLMSLQKGFVLMMVNTLIILLVFGGSMGMFSFFMWYKRTALERRLLREAEEVKRLARVKVEAIVNSLDVGVYTKPVADDLESGVNCIDIDSGEAGAADSTNTNSRTAFDNEVDCCAICLEEMEVGDQIRVLPLCVHGANFHLMCLDQWLMDVQSCPMCKARLAEDESECESECDEAENGNVNASDGPESEGHSSEDDEDNNSSTLLTGSSNRTSGSVRDTEVGHVMSSHFLNGNDAEDGGEDDDVDDSGDGYVRKSHLLPASDDTDIDVSDVARGEINSKGITAEHRPASSTEHTEVGMELRSIFRNDNASKMHEGNIRISKSNISENISGRESLRVDDDQERGDECDTDEQTRLV
ncbi:hypothetical protein SARC_03928 [Sphaeroforma arctica JP610]|uniref:RING-type domain-containing protein n=1 Tax=Sphaeroforma arctica JP610 TaxID=667725 RepID=A0A0L0G4V5_9EUKA|nr:hypothetical protein SARC_03928 [Sphaeroforma arctica JP610]KNC83846.1 hypothetical protein SARC_03928 [Sphaeroforma arctica JP610]|eukprot:XP_014157748.1 hypothetical protein SARC_03928 [Sphaeroforma arctica JP610]